MKKFIRLILLLSTAVVMNTIPLTSHAAFSCSQMAVYDFTAPTASINTQVPNGTVMYTTTVFKAKQSMTCSASTVDASLLFDGSGTYQGSNLYDTGIPGISMRLKAASGLCATHFWPDSCSAGVNNTGLFVAMNMQVELIKTGPITGGGSLTGEFAKGRFGPPDGEYVQFLSLRWGTPLVIVPKNPTCNVSTGSGNIAVTLPEARVTDFRGVGTEAGTLENFSIDLTCSGGDPGTSANMYITLTDATTPSNTTDMLSPTAATASTGVGVRIFKGSTPVQYGPDSSAVGNLHQWFVQQVNPGNSTVTIPLSARYVQVDPTVQAGPVSAIATFTMAYN